MVVTSVMNQKMERLIKLLAVILSDPCLLND